MYRTTFYNFSLVLLAVFLLIGCNSTFYKKTNSNNLTVSQALQKCERDVNVDLKQQADKNIAYGEARAHAIASTPTYHTTVACAGFTCVGGTYADYSQSNLRAAEAELGSVIGTAIGLALAKPIHIKKCMEKLGFTTEKTEALIGYGSGETEYRYKGKRYGTANDALLAQEEFVVEILGHIEQFDKPKMNKTLTCFVPTPNHAEEMVIKYARDDAKNKEIILDEYTNQFRDNVVYYRTLLHNQGLALCRVYKRLNMYENVTMKYSDGGGASPSNEMDVFQYEIASAGDINFNFSSVKDGKNKVNLRFREYESSKSVANKISSNVIKHSFQANNLVFEDNSEDDMFSNEISHDSNTNTFLMKAYEGNQNPPAEGKRQGPLKTKISEEY